MRASSSSSTLAEFDAAVSEFHPDLLAARAVHLAALERSRGIGAALDSRLELESTEGSNSGSLQLDVLAVAGIGRLPCAEAVARAEVLLADAGERLTAGRALARTRGTLARRARLIAERARLVAFREEIEPALERSRVLADSGFSGAAVAAESRGIDAAIRARLSRLAADVAIVDLELAIVTGGAFDPERVPRSGDLTIDLDTIALDDGCVALSVPLAALVVAEARLRLAASRSWPDLAIGPTFRLTPGVGILGGMLELEFDDPRKVTAEVSAATIERDLAASDLACGLHRLETARDLGREEWSAARAAAEAGLAASSDAARAELAARARYEIDPALAGEWHRMSEARLSALESEFELRALAEETATRLAADFAAPEALR